MECGGQSGGMRSGSATIFLAGVLFAGNALARPRDYVGLQAGSTGWGQLIYRLRVAGPLLVDTGFAMGVTAGLGLMNGSGGIVLEPFEGLVAPYIGAGVGFGCIVGDARQGGKHTLIEQRTFGYARVGLA